MCCYIVLFFLVLCLVCPMVSMSLDCPLLITHSVFSNVCFSSSCVLCIQCCRCLWIVHYWLHLRFSLTFVFPHPVSCVSNVVDVSGLFIIDYTFGFLYVYFKIKIECSYITLLIWCRKWLSIITVAKFDLGKKCLPFVGTWVYFRFTGGIRFN